jgi:exodeoxyribonuclease VII large subunit
VEDTFSSSTDSRADYTVLSLNLKVKELLQTAFPYPVWLRGEVSQTPRVTARGHMYFQLVDPGAEGSSPQASIDCALFASSKNQAVRDFARQGLVFDPVEGMSIRVLGRVDLWPRGGRYQFTVQKVDPMWTRGERALALQRLLERLRDEGVLGANASLEISSLPLRVGLVTSRDSAAASDFLKTLDESNLPFEVYASWASMQGRDAADAISASLRALADVEPPLDVAVITRGGGSQSDLDWLNDEHIGRAIADSPWPVVSGIGHEIDGTLPDYAAHTSAKTPTHAASLLVDRVAGFLTDLEAMASLLSSISVPKLAQASSGLESAAFRLRDLTGLRMAVEAAATDRMLRQLGEAAERAVRGFLRDLDGAATRVTALAPGARTGIELHRLSSVRQRMESSAHRRLSEQQLLLERLESEVTRRSPEDMMALGWSLVHGPDGRLIRSVSNVRQGDELSVTMSDGSLSAAVKSIAEKETGESG